MRIAVVTSTFLPTRNGVTIHIKSLVKELERQGHEAWVISPWNGKKSFCKNDIRISSVFNPMSKLYPLALNSRIPKEIKGVKFDAVHLHHPVGVYGLALKIAERDHCPLFFTNHTQYLAYTDYYLPLFAGVGKKLMARRLKELYSKAAAVIGSTSDIENEIKSIYPRTKVAVIPVGFDQDRLRVTDNPNIKTKIGLKEEDFWALYVGRVSKEKNIDALIEAARELAPKHPELKVVIVGPGDYISEAKMKAGPNVIITGQPSDTDLVNMYRHCDLFLTASTSEVLPLTLSEAAYCDAPLLGIDSLGVRDIIIDGENGILSKNKASFIKNLGQLVDSPERLASFREKSKQSVLRYSAKVNLRKVIALYEKTIKE